MDARMDDDDFFCGAKQLPDRQQIAKILAKIQDSFVRSLEPGAIANSLVIAQLISNDHKFHICNEMHSRQARIRNLFGYIQMCGDRPETLMKLYNALINTSDTPSHLVLARHLRSEALKFCEELPCPIFDADEKNKQKRLKVVKIMAQNIPRIEIERNVALELERHLDFGESCTELNDISAICLKWIEEKKEKCTPHMMVKALLLTKGLGRYASRLACPWVNLPEVKKFLVSCENKVFEIANFLGFVEIEEGLDNETVVEKLLEEWKLPDFGECSSQYLQDLKRRVIPEICQPDCQGKLLSELHDKQPPWNLGITIGSRWTENKEFCTFSFAIPTAPQQVLTPTGQQRQIESPMLSIMHQPIATPPIAYTTSSPTVEEPDHDKEENESHFKEDTTDSLHEAIRKRLKNNLVYLLKNCNKDVNTRGNDWRTPLMFACKMKYIDGLRTLLRYNANPNLKDKDGFACLHYKEVLESREIMMLLVERGANIEIESDDKMSPFSMACVYGLQDSIRVLLLQLNANINGLPSADYTPLSIAVQCGNESTVNSILDCDKDNLAINVHNKDGSTALLRACELKQAEIAIKLISSGANVHAQSKNGCTTVFFAAYTNSIELLQHLIIYKADLNKPGVVTIQDNSLLLTPLSAAAASGYYTAVQLLVKNEVDVNFVPSSTTLTPLWWTTPTDQFNMAEYLLKLNETRKDIFALKPVIDLVISNDRYGIGSLILLALGGEEKALQEAKQESIELEGLVTIMIEGVKEMKRKRRNESVTSSQHTPSVRAPLGKEEDAHAKQRLNEFVQYSIETFLLGRNPNEALSDEHIDQGQLEFFQNYLNNTNQPDLFPQFIKGPCHTIFNSRYFTGKRLSTVLSRHEKIYFIADLPAIFLYYALQAPEFQQCDSELDGEQLMRQILGDRFIAEVNKERLFDSISTQADATLDTIAIQQTRDHNHPSDSSTNSVRVVPANNGLPEIYIRMADITDQDSTVAYDRTSVSEDNMSLPSNEDHSRYGSFESTSDSSAEDDDEEQDTVKTDISTEINMLLNRQQQLQLDMQHVQQEIHHIQFKQDEMMKLQTRILQELKNQTIQLAELTAKKRRPKER